MAYRRLSMRKIHTVLRLYFAAGLSIRAIGRSIHASPSTVGDYIRRAEVAGLSWPLPHGMDERGLEAALFPPPRFAFAAPVRKIIYTTNAIESLHSNVRKTIRNKGHFPNDEAASKLIWLALRNITAKWQKPPIAWAQAKSQFAIQFGDRFKLDD